MQDIGRKCVSERTASEEPHVDTLMAQIALPILMSCPQRVRVFGNDVDLPLRSTADPSARSRRGSQFFPAERALVIIWKLDDPIPHPRIEANGTGGIHSLRRVTCDG